MDFHPSLLEYSQEALISKLKQVNSNIDLFLQLIKAKKLNFHLDMVLEEFARDISVMKSCSPKTVLESLDLVFKEQCLNLSIHLMGLSTDLKDCYEFFQMKPINKNWQYTVFVPEKFYNFWTTLPYKNLKIGIWYDLKEWEAQTFIKNVPYLIMTVKAGKSGQKLETDIANKSLKIVEDNPLSDFYLDGGWQVDFRYPDLNNLKVVSYSSFWKKFNESQGLG